MRNHDEKGKGKDEKRERKHRHEKVLKNIGFEYLRLHVPVTFFDAFLVFHDCRKKIMSFSQID